MSTEAEVTVDLEETERVDELDVVASELGHGRSMALSAFWTIGSFMTREFNDSGKVISRGFNRLVGIKTQKDLWESIASRVNTEERILWGIDSIKAFGTTADMLRNVAHVDKETFFDVFWKAQTSIATSLIRALDKNGLTNRLDDVIDALYKSDFKDRLKAIKKESFPEKDSDDSSENEKGADAIATFNGLLTMIKNSSPEVRGLLERELVQDFIARIPNHTDEDSLLMDSLVIVIRKLYKLTDDIDEVEEIDGAIAVA